MLAKLPVGHGFQCPEPEFHAKQLTNVAAFDLLYKTPFPPDLPFEEPLAITIRDGDTWKWAVVSIERIVTQGSTLRFRAKMLPVTPNWGPARATTTAVTSGPSYTWTHDDIRRYFPPPDRGDVADLLCWQYFIYHYTGAYFC